MVDGPDCKVNMECVFVTCKEIPAPNKALSHFSFFYRYPIIFPRHKCAGDLGDRPGVRSYGLRPADERYDVYCYTDGLKGKKTLVKVDKDAFTSSFPLIIIVGLLVIKTALETWLMLAGFRVEFP